MLQQSKHQYGPPNQACPTLTRAGGNDSSRLVLNPGSTMAKYGTWMLEKLVLQYCAKDGSSAGMREFLSHTLPALQARNPQLEVQEFEKPHRHPKVVALYRSGRSKPIDVKNLSSRDIEEHVSWLRTSHGRDQEYKVTTSRHLSRNPSIQGMWSIDTFAAQLQRRNAKAVKKAAVP